MSSQTQHPSSTRPRATTTSSTSSTSTSNTISTQSSSSSSSSTFTSKSHLPTSIPRNRIGRLYPACLPGGFIKKYRQPPSTSIPYPRGEVDLLEAIKQRRGVAILGKIDGYALANTPEEDEDWEWEDEEILVVGDGSVGDVRVTDIVRYETFGGRFKRVWERVAFWDSGKNTRRRRRDPEQNVSDPNYKV